MKMLSLCISATCSWMWAVDLVKAYVHALWARPFTVLGVNIVVVLIVPGIARLAGNNDPDENAISHVFGQASICVAMDFPGWFEAATTIFFFSGLSSGYAVYEIYRHCKEMWGGKQLPLGIFMGAVILLMNLFWMVGLFNPVTDHSYGRVLAHTLPYLGLQLAYFALMVFVLIALRPVCGKCRRVSWYAVTVVYMLGQLLGWFMIIYTFVEFARHEGTGENGYKGPMNRYAHVFAYAEPGILLFRWLSLMLHPLKLEASPKSKDEKAEVEV